jgi:uncharacterized protein
MIGIDTNILLYSLNPDSRWHKAAKKFLNQALADEHIVISDLVLVELYLLLRNPLVLKKPLTPKAATSVTKGYLGLPRVKRAEFAPVMDEVWRMAARPQFARRRIIDVRLALTLRHHGVTRLATANTKDFKDLGFSRVWSPLT